MPMPRAALLGPSAGGFVGIQDEENAKQWQRYQRASISTRVTEYGVLESMNQVQVIGVIVGDVTCQSST